MGAEESEEVDFLGMEQPLNFRVLMLLIGKWVKQTSKMPTGCHKPSL